MEIFDLYSKTQKILRGEVPEIFRYDLIPKNLKIKIVHIINDTIGEDSDFNYPYAKKIYKNIHKILCREYGLFGLTDSSRDSNKDQIINFFLRTEEIEKVLDVIELVFGHINTIIRNDYQRYSYYTNSKEKPDDAIAELNERLKEEGIGYSFESNEIIRIDSTYIHSDITKPVISLLRNNKFIGANEEYLKAHEHYRNGRNKECLTECLKAFESTMKIICSEKNWTFKQKDTAKNLIQVCFQNQLVPTFTQNQFTSLQNLLESGIPTIRNKLGGHGQGQTLQKVDDQMTRYGLNLTGTNILFLIEQSGIK